MLYFGLETLVFKQDLSDLSEHLNQKREHHSVDVTDAFGVAGNSFDIGKRKHPSRIYIRKK